MAASEKPVLLLTRPAPASQRFFDDMPPEVRAAVTLCISPLFRVEAAVELLDPGPARGLILSSVNGVAVAARVSDRRDLPAFCVGVRTTRAASEAGFAAIQCGQDADELVAELVRRNPAGPLLHLHGRHARGDIARRLTARGMPTTEKVIYDQPAQPLSDDVRAHLQGARPVVLPLFSPRSASLFVDAHTGAAPLHVIAMSSAVAEAAAPLCRASLDTAATPDAASMRGLVARKVEQLGAG